MTKEEVSFGREHSRVSPSFTCPALAKIFAVIFVVARLIARRMEYRAAGRKNAGRTRTFLLGGEQRVTRGSILYRGRGPPLVTAVFSPVHDRCHSLRTAVAATPKPSGDTPRTSWGPYRALPLQPPRTLGPVACLRE